MPILEGIFCLRQPILNTLIGLRNSSYHSQPHLIIATLYSNTVEPRWLDLCRETKNSLS